MTYADVILPLPLYSTFSYYVPDDLLPLVKRGSRVLVQFGKKKFYTGIVADLTKESPGDFEVKPLMSLLDDAPVTRFPQMKLWQWVADYYLCSAGDVYKAAIPAGLKPESETWISLNPDFDNSDDWHPTPRQAVILDCLESEKKMRIADIQTKTNIKDATAVINRMLEAGVVEVAEKVEERYRPKKVKLIRLNAERGDSKALHEMFDRVTRSRQQEKLLMTYIELSHWLSPRTEDLKTVTRKQLTEATGVSSAVMRAMIDKGIFREEQQTVLRFNPDASAAVDIPPLTGPQQTALDSITGSFAKGNVTLLHGVTGSGKTEIYAHLMQKALADGNQVLMLVPEISLTTQLTDRLRRMFGNRLLVYHSRFSDNERVDIYKRLLAGSEPLIVIGARSAVFLPFARLGLVVVDEEHDPSYKQYDPAPRYNARDTAIVLATMHGAKVLLGSATPSIETYWKALGGKYGLVSLGSRYENAELPDVTILDMKQLRKEKQAKGILSVPLRKAVTESLASGKQAIMFQNRRGFAPIVVCRQCGWTPKCPNCDVSLVYHKHNDTLRCHYCGHTIVRPTMCPACEDNTIETYGYGTERIAEEMQEAFPEARLSRMDLDTTRNKEAYQDIIEEFSRHDTDLLVGTQMVTKGLDFSGVETVGVLNADTMLNFPDFRSNERAFNMLEQVAGRAGRRGKGRVMVQTTDPENRVLGYVKAHDYAGYYESELEDRRKYGYPPFSRIINVYLKNKDRATVDEAAVKFALALRQVFGQRVFGPERPFVSRVATYCLQSIMLKVEAEASMSKVKALLRTIYESLARDRLFRTTMLYYDVDPS